MIKIERARPDDFWLTARGVWRGSWKDNRRTATISCPACGQVASLSGHDIESDGTVQPSVVCPRGSCAFHDYVMLDEWSD